MKTLKSKMYPGGMLLILVLTLGLASLGAAAEGIWAKKADMAVTKYLHGSCAVAGKIYVVGGTPTPMMGSSVVEEYDPATDTWARKADMPTPRAGLGVSAVDGKIYAIGGPREVEEYDPTTDTWTQKGNMPTARTFLTTSVVNGKIYAIGGSPGGTAGPGLRTVEEYDPETNMWTRKADLPEPRYLHAASVVDGRIYVIGGSWQEYTASDAVFAYDPATDTWERKADAPTVRSWLSAGVADGRIYVIGGDFRPPKANVEEYDPATDTWRRLPDMPTPRGALSLTTLNDTIYVIGGTITVYSGLSTVEAFTPNPLVVDFNGDGMVGIEDLLRLIESWGQDDPDMDIGPTVFGDGTIDAADLEVLMRYWYQQPADVTLLSHWALDESEGVIAVDSAGARHAEVVGDPLWQPDGGTVGGALEFNGATVLIADSVGNLSQGPFSVFAWVKGGAAGQVIISENAGANWLGIDAVLGTLMSGLQSAGRFSNPLYSDACVTDDSWHRVGFRWDGNTKSLYVDDVLVAEGVDTGLACSEGGLSIGCGCDATPDTFFTGLIDDVRIYNRVVWP